MSEVQPIAVVAWVSDLMFGSKITAAARAQQVSVRLVRSAETLNEAIALGNVRHVILDLSVATDDLMVIIAQLKRDHSEIRITAFASHVDTDHIAAARRAGADAVLARSAFSANIDSIIAL
jgi:DNA-binding NarL/FixJ family response regulator